MGVPAKPALWGKLAGQCECDPQFWIHRGLNCKAESLAISFFHERSKEVRFRLTASSFSLVRKGTKSTLRRETRSAPNAEGRVLRSSVFPLRIPFFTGAQARSASVYFRRGVSRHTKPLIIADAPMAFVKVCRADEKCLPCWFACGCGGANERKPHKFAPEQRQRKEDGRVLTKESAIFLPHG